MLRKAHTLNCMKRKENLITSLREHSILALRAEKAMSFQEVELKERKSPVINQTQFIWAVDDNIKQKAFQYSIKQSTA